MASHNNPSPPFLTSWACWEFRLAELKTQYKSQEEMRLLWEQHQANMLLIYILCLPTAKPPTSVQIYLPIVPNVLNRLKHTRPMRDVITPLQTHRYRLHVSTKYFTIDFQEKVPWGKGKKKKILPCVSAHQIHLRLWQMQFNFPSTVVMW